VCAGKIYNAGGGPSNTMSLLELISLIENKLNKKLKYDYSDWRPGDQKIYISDIGKIKSDTGWEPKINVNDGVGMMIDWISDNRPMFKKLNLV
jgi:CDP-paratose 2-epimerase